MSTATTELQTELVELSSKSFDVFCKDISSMFDVEMESIQTGRPSEEKIIDLKKRFKKIYAFNTVNTEGRLDGKFYLVFDQGGAFTLSGVIAMMPEERILEEIKKGIIEDVESMAEAIREIGNLAIGAWDRIFRENFAGHVHFAQDDVYIGNGWDDTKDALGIESDEEIMFIPYEITISSLPTFKCGVIFPKSLLEEKTPVETKAKAQETEAQDDDLIQEDQSNTEPVQSDDAIQQSEPSHHEGEAPKQDEAAQVSESIREMTRSQASLAGGKNFFALNIKAKDIMNENIIWCSSEDCVHQALSKMQEHNTWYLMIGEENQSVEGIISKSDLDAAMSPYLRPIFAKWKRDLDDATLKIKLKWIMCKTICFIRPQTPLVAIIQKMKKSAKLCLPVMEDNKVLGIITVSDIFSVILNNCPEEYKNLRDEI